MRYSDKIITADQAAQLVKDNDIIVINHANMAPRCFVEAIMKRRNELRNVRFSHYRVEEQFQYIQEDMRPAFTQNALMVGWDTRKNMENATADYVPNGFYNVGPMFERGYYNVDIASCQISEPDADGYCSFGCAVAYMPEAIHAAKISIGEINKQIPHTLGAKIHYSEFTHLIEADYPVIINDIAPAGEVEKKIGGYIATLIDDGSTLQVGLGNIPNATLECLRNHKNLGIHSEVCSDGIAQLMESGVVNGSKKTVHPFMATATFLRGSKHTLDFFADNKALEMQPATFTNNPMIICQHHKFVGINGAIEIDATGQICAESIGTRFISGPGGQLDFALGANWAKDGKFIIALTSTAAKGKSSRIVANLSEGAGVTTVRQLADYVVTEFGIASLRGKNLTERAKALLAICHPDFQEAMERGICERHDMRRYRITV